MPRARRRTAGQTTASHRRTQNRPQVPFAHKLVLNQWLLSLFGVQSFRDLAQYLRDESLEGLDEDGVHRFYRALTTHFPDRPQLPSDLLLAYDQNIVKHTRWLNEHRLTHGEKPITWKYFQYLMLLFTEIYLDRYFRDPQGLLRALNAHVAAYNAGKPASDQIAPFDEQAEAWTQLNKLAYWSATGSGKTLLMHVNILQYQYYLEKYGRRRELNRIILLTPNEGLSQQHLREFQVSGILAQLFNKDGPDLFAGKSVEILDIHKLSDEMGDKTVAVEAFEGNNLVLVDEGHRGASSGDEGTWMRYRNALCDKGFSFEYSATFGQAVKGNKALIDLYAKSIIFDYSYRYFYGDGFGKDYQIFNLEDETQQNHLELYLVACLLSFYQQQRLYREQVEAFRPFNIEKPLWIFVGGSVTKTLTTREASDIIEILRFLARYVANRRSSIALIDRLLKRGLITADGKNLFARHFYYLQSSGMTAAQIFDETLATVFNAPGGGRLYVENLKGASGEIALRVGDNKPFGVINVGDDSKLCKLCEEYPELTVTEREFSDSLFHTINEPDSTINLLIGSKKFTEGWNSWRVSTMGLMNIGQGEGPQIIQLFGRGVRLKGYGMSLKRSSETRLPADLMPPKHISILETLGVFGIRANYMAQFRDFLKEEGLPTNEDRIEFILPVVRNLGTQKLKIIRLKRTINGVNTEVGDAFRRLGPVPTLTKPDPARDPSTEYLLRNQVALNWYPRIQTLRSREQASDEVDAAPNETHLTGRHVAFLDIDRLYFELERFKAERGWYNLNLTREGIMEILLDHTWYKLLIPDEELSFDSFDKVRLWEEIALTLLKKYMERFYTFRKREWELKHLEYRILEENDPNLEWKEDAGGSYYRVYVPQSADDIILKLEELKRLIQEGKLKFWEYRGIKAILFKQHLYEPLLYLDGDAVKITPVPLNKGEFQFVEDLKVFHDTAHAEFLAGRELYLLRNFSKGRGVGFFEAGNFHPDFILWVVSGPRQDIVFIDPKGGLEHIGPTSPKIEFHRTIKDIERRLGDPNVHLHSFILSTRPSWTMARLWNMSKDEMLSRHILFPDEDKQTYIRSMLEMVVPKSHPNS